MMARTSRHTSVVVVVVVLSWLVVAPASARADTEWVLILDNSSSMEIGGTLELANGTKVPTAPADPERLAVIATLIFRSLMDASDKLTILIFDSSSPGIFRTLPNVADDVRAVGFDTLTYFVGPLQEARRILESSTAENKILLLLTDGAPSDEDASDTQPAISGPQAKALLGLDQGKPKFEVWSLGLSNDVRTRPQQIAFLEDLGRFDQIDTATQLVQKFTEAYADSIRSRPDTGSLKPGAEYGFSVPKYVSEVLVSVATEKPTGVFTAELSGDGANVTAIDGGDNGCKTPPRCHAYQVFKHRRDPDKAADWTLKLPGGRGAVAYGIILRYELHAEIVSMSEAKAGEEKQIIARLTFKGQPFNDAQFFERDGFKAALVLGDQEVDLALRPSDGSFVGTVRVPAPGPQTVEARFSNQWIQLVASREFDAEAWLDLNLVVNPTPLDFGEWTGARAESSRCIHVDLAGSLNADRVPLEAYGEHLPAGYSLRTARQVTLDGSTFEVCLVAPGCCSNRDAPDGAVLILRGADPHYHSGAVTVPLVFKLEATPFITCWWRVIASIIGAIILIIIVNGFVRPKDFDSEEVIRLAQKEKGLSRAPGRRLRELPGGRRGFYRDARVAFDGTGNAIRGKSGAALVLTAARGDPMVTGASGLEMKDPRTRKWTPVDASDGAIYLRRSIVYRTGEFCFRMG